MKGRIWPAAAIVAAIALTPQIVLAAVGNFSSSTSTPAVTGTNSSSTGKAVYGRATSTSASTHYGVYGGASGAGGIGLYGLGTKYGVYSNGHLGIRSGKSLICNACVGNSAIAPSTWTDITSFFNNWTTYSSSDLNYPKLRYYVDSNKVLHLRGWIKDGTFSLAFSVPNALAPAKQILAVVPTDAGFTTASMGAGNGGVYITLVGGATRYSLDSVSWPING